MKRGFAFFLSTALAGLFLLLPLVALGYLLYIANEVLVELARLSGLQLPFNDTIDGLIIGLCALFAVLGACFVVGMALRTGIGRAVGSRYDDLLDKHFPVVGMLRNLVMQIVGAGREVTNMLPAEIDLYGGPSRNYGLVVEELPDGRTVVFIPSAPAATLGQIHVVPSSAVTLLDAPVQDMVNAVTQWGAGASIIYDPQRASSAVNPKDG